MNHARSLSVVFIRTSAVVQDLWSRNVLSVPRGTGSGFIWDDAGHVVTNYHVIEGASEATVKLVDGSDYKCSLIGINTAIYSPSGTSAGIGFAVPVDTVNRVVPQLIRFGKYVRPTLGLRMDEDLNQRLASALEVRGVVVLRSPTGRLAPGLQESTLTRDGSIFLGDIITAVNGKSVETIRQLALLLDELRVGDVVSVRLLRKGKLVVMDARLQAGD